MKVFIIGTGGREHALAHTFWRQGHLVYVLPGNPGMEEIAEVAHGLNQTDFHSLSRFAKQHHIDLTVVGPEAPLSEGIADHFEKVGLRLFGPTKKAARLESSKAYSKQFCQDHHIPSAKFHVCHTPEEAIAAIDNFFEKWGGVVLKADGLAAGKGVIVCKEKKQAYAAVDALMREKKYGESGSVIIVEELLHGPEVSLLAFCDGKRMVPMIPSQDHKRLLDNDEGPNTGGVGAYAPLPFLTQDDYQAIVDKIVTPTKEGLLREEIDYRGVIYFGIMLTKKGPMLLEYNCRFGDPEAQVVLPLLNTDLAAIMVACCRGDIRTTAVRWKNQSACCVVMTSTGYPEAPKSGDPIDGLNLLKEKPELICYHSGTKRENEKILTSGGRVLGITALSPTLDEAISYAYSGIEKVTFPGRHYRKDIGQKSKT